MPGTAVGAGATPMSKTNKITSLWYLRSILGRETKKGHDDK